MNTVIFQKRAILKHSACKIVGTGTQAKKKTKQKDAQELPVSGGLLKKKLPLHTSISLLNHQESLVYSIFINIVAVVVVSRAAENRKSWGWYVALGNL